METRTSQLAQNSINAGESTRVLLHGLIDYAGLFPPASLGMAAAISNYEPYLRGEYRWLLGRFIVPVARLGEFDEAVGRLPPGQTVSQWSLSALQGADLPADLGRIREFNERFAASPSARTLKIDSIELKIAGADEIERLLKLIPAELETYFEIPWMGAASTEMRNCIAAVAACGRRAKIR